MNDSIRKKRYFFLFIILFFLVDFVTKQLVIHCLREGQSNVLIPHFFSLTLAKNEGIAFSMLDGEVPMIILLSIVVIWFLMHSIRHGFQNYWEFFGYAFVIGGALGNLFDRIIYGYVIDFLDFNIFGWDYPIFNFADCFVVVGIIILLIISFRERGDVE